MLNSSLDKSTNILSYNSLKSDVETLQKIIAGYSSLFTSEQVKTSDIEATKGNIGTLDVTKVFSENLKSDTLQTNVLQAGTSVLGDTIVESLKIKSGDVELEADTANIESATIKDLKVTSSIELPTLDNLSAENITGNVVTANTRFDLATKTLAEYVLGTIVFPESISFTNANRPKWNSKELAIIADITGLYYRGTVATKTDLPSTANNGDIYFVTDTTSFAIYSTSSGEWSITEIPALSAYRTAELQDAIDKDITDNITALTSTVASNKTDADNKITNLSTELSSYETTTNATITSIQEKQTEDETTLTDVNTRLTTVEDDYLKDAPKDENYYCRHNGEWSTIGTEENSVPKKYSDDTVTNTITNDANGITLESNKAITATTASSTTTTTKEVINQEYLRKNLSISKSASNDTVLKTKPLIVSDNYGNMLSSSATTGSYFLGNIGNNTGNYGGFTVGYVGNTVKRTRDYLITTTSSNSTAAFSGEYYINIIDDNGNITAIDCPLASGTFLAYQYPYSIGVFDTDLYEDYPEIVNYWYILGTCSRDIYLYDGATFKAKIAMDDQFATDMQESSIAAQGVTFTSLKSKPEILLRKSSSSYAYILGLNENNEVDFTSYKRVNFPVAGGLGTIYGGKTHWFCKNGLIGYMNQLLTMDSLGNSNISLLQTDSGSVLYPSAVYEAPFGFNKDGTIVIATTAEESALDTPVTTFIYIEEKDDDSVDVSVIQSSVCWANSNAGAPSFAGFFEAGNYIFFLPKPCYSGPYWTSMTSMTIGVYQGTKTLDYQNMYCTINKTTKAITYHTYPLTTTTSAIQNVEWFRTKDDYVWIWNWLNGVSPNGQCLVVSPTGDITTLDIGTGSKYVWQPSSNMSCWSGDNRYVTPLSQPRAYVTPDGIGVIFSADYTAFCVFYGNGNYRVYEGYTARGYSAMAVEYNILQRNTSLSGYDYYAGNVYYNIRNGFVGVDNKIMFTSAGADNFARNMNYYIEINPDDPLGDIVIKSCYTKNTTAYYGFSPAWYSNAWHDYREWDKINAKHIEVTSGDACVNPLVVYSTSPTNQTIYLKDGDYVISNT